MNADTPPFSFVVSYDDQENDNRSELTGPCEGDESPRNEDDFDRILAMMDPSKIGRPPTGDDRLVADVVPTKEKGLVDLTREVARQRRTLAEKQELLDLKLRLAKQEKMLNLLSSKLTKSQAENETLRTEKASLIDQLASARDAIERDAEEQSTSPHGRFSLRGSGVGSNGYGGSMEVLIDANARLKADNAYLQVSLDSVQKSLQSHIRSSQSISCADKQAIKELRQENETLRCRLGHSMPPRRSMELSESELTSKTSFTSDCTWSEQLSQMKRGSFEEAASCLGISCDRGNDEGHVIESCDGVIGKIKCYKEGKAVKRNRVAGKIAPCGGSDELIVDFREARRSSFARKYSPYL